MSNYSDYVYFLRKKLTEEGDKQRLKEFSESVKRLSEFEKDSKERLNAEIELLNKIKTKEAEEMKRRTAEEIKKLQSQKGAEEDKFKALSEKLVKEAEEKLQESLNVYDQVILKNIHLLEIEQLKVKEKLLDTDADLRKVEEEFQETSHEENEKTEAVRQKLNEEKGRRDQERFDEIIQGLNQRMESEIKVGKEVVEKNNEIRDAQIGHIEDLTRSNMSMQRNIIQTLLIRNSQYNSRVMNNLLEGLSRINSNINEAYKQCIRHMPDGTDKTPGQLERAQDSFENFSSISHRAREELIRIERRLVEVENKEIEKEMKDSMRKMKSTLFSLGNCIARFCGRLMVGNTAKHDEDEKELKTLMMELSEIEFPIFNPQNNVMRRHLESNMPTVEPTGQNQLQE